MGRGSSLGNVISGNPAYIPYDLFRFSAPSTRTFATGTSAYFSINNGTTNLHGYNSGSGDPQDWDSSIHDEFNASTPSGQENDLTPSDMIAMDVIGYDVALPAAVTWKGNNAGGLWDAAFTKNFNNHTTLTTTDVYRVADNVTFDDTATTFNVLINANQYPGGVIAMNSSNNYTFSSNVAPRHPRCRLRAQSSGTGSLTLHPAQMATPARFPVSPARVTSLSAHPTALGTGTLAIHLGGTTRLQAGLASGVKLPSVTFDGVTECLDRHPRRHR